MTTEERSRSELYARVAEVSGDEHAVTLFRYLPGAPGPELATKADVQELGDRLDGRMDRLQSHMERFDDRLHDLHGALPEQTRQLILASTATMVTLAAAFAAFSLI